MVRDAFTTFIGTYNFFLTPSWEPELLLTGRMSDPFELESVKIFKSEIKNDKGRTNKSKNKKGVTILLYPFVIRYWGGGYASN